jgi:hypothetical protein
MVRVGGNLLTLGVLVLNAIGCGAGEVQADWQYVKWGTTVDQVITASKGEARVITSKLPWAPTDCTKQIAHMTSKQIDTFTVDIVVCADVNGRVNSVVLRPISQKGSYGQLRSALLARYGRPVEDKTDRISWFMSLSLTSWRDEAGGNFVELSNFLETTGGKISDSVLLSYSAIRSQL